MGVYLDAVFQPNVLTDDNIFKQEGWRYELSSADAPITINGVVYNEMKGNFSNPQSILSNTINQSLFQDIEGSKDKIKKNKGLFTKVETVKY